MNSAKKAALVLAAAGMAVSASVSVAAAHGEGGGAFADGVAKGSPGIISGNVIQLPIQVPINLCGNSIDIVGLLNPTFGNTCINADVDRHEDFGHEGHGGHGGRY
ncbi:chaplin [Streptomyces olivoreticuli]|uniref:chaplin n=1 Tax=Streptomyces olivoreticuli TaxID=68246 RepID=UPI000E23ACB2|nr:chaplin [Streptomyces olivoreticuli]